MNFKSAPYAIATVEFFGSTTLAYAERVECTLHAPCTETVCTAPGIPLSFEIDHNQFAPPVNAGEPPRNKVTLVALGGETFRAEPIVMGDTRGFWAHVAGDDRLLTVRPDGMGTYAATQGGVFLTARCGVTR